jgi:hypothetical protein
MSCGLAISQSCLSERKTKCPGCSFYVERSKKQAADGKDRYDKDKPGNSFHDIIIQEL